MRSRRITVGGRMTAVILLCAAAAVLWSVLQITGNAPQTAPGAPRTAAAGIPQVPAPPPAALTVQDISGPLGTVLADLRYSDRHYTEAWVTESYGSDLRALMAVTDYADGTNPLNVDCRVFTTDADAYLNQNGGMLQPGWQAEYATVRADLNRLAASTGLPPAPAPPDSYGLSAKPDMTLPWQPPANAAGSAAPACTTKNTVTDSSSSTGAHSQSVKTTTKCGTGTSATTSSHTARTSVSKTGAVTVTNTSTSG